MTKDEALKLALEALERGETELRWKAIKTVKEALAQPDQDEKFCDNNCVWTDHHPDCKLAEQEPVAWMDNDGNISDNNDHNCFPIPLYTTPPQRKPLEEREREWIVATCPTPRHIIKAVEAAHGIKE